MTRPILLAALALASSPAWAQSQVCRVADPTGTPLNIRLQPNGAVVDSVPNRAEIVVFHGEERRDSRGRLWYSVALMDSAAPDGYALAAFVRCP